MHYDGGMRMTTGDELLALIREHVRQQVPAAHRDKITEMVANILLMVMSEQRFYSQLRVVLDLQAENSMLRNELAKAVALVNRLASARVPVPYAKPRKKAAAKKVGVKPKIQVKGSTASNRRAFKEGYRGT